MSILPELVLQQVLVKGIRGLREQPNLVDMLFRNLHQDEVTALRQYIRDSSIDIALNWPLENVKVPSIIISLKSEAESEAFLGHLIQGPTNIRATGTPYQMDELVAPATTLGSGSQTTVGSLAALLADPIQVTSATASTFQFPITDDLDASNPFDVPYGDLVAVIRKGTGSGQRRVVSDIAVATNTLLEATVTANWGTTPDTTSIIEFQHIADFEFTGEPSKLFTSSDVLERQGAQYKTTYQMLIIGPDQEMTIFLYAMVKAIIFINYDYLTRHGMINPTMSGTDFVARNDFLPERAHQRALSIEFDHTFDVYLTQEVISQINIGVEVYDPDVTDGSGVGKIASNTSITLP